MKTVKTYRYKLRGLSKTTVQAINSWTGACRYVYNLALETKQYAYKTYGLSLSCYDLSNQLPSLKQEADWIKAVPAQTLQAVIERLDKAFQSFFKGGGYPKWARKDRYTSLLFKSVSLVKEGVFKLPKLGKVKVFYSRNIPKDAKLKTATINKQTDGYFLSVTFETTIQPVRSENQAVGLDWGVASFATLSTGEQIANPRLFQRFSSQLRRLQRSLARKVKNSRSWRKTRRKLQKLFLKIKKVRTDFQHKASTWLCRTFGLIAVEDLRIKNISKSAKGTTEEPGSKVRQKAGLNRSILDTAPSAFIDKLTYKAQWQDVDLVKVKPHHSSQQCHACGHTEKENRVDQRTFCCKSCGHTAHADLNAAKNILARAKASVA